MSSEIKKQVFSLAGCQIIAEPSRPHKFRMWAFIPDLNMRTSDVFTNEIEAGKKQLVERVGELRRTVPARNAAFDRLETALRLKFENLRHGYEFLNALQDGWRNAKVERLLELCETVEAIEAETSGWIEYPNAGILIKSPESLNSNNCPNCGRETYQGKTCFKCGLSKSAASVGSAEILGTEDANSKSMFNANPSPSDISDAPYIKTQCAEFTRRKIGNIAV